MYIVKLFSHFSTLKTLVSDNGIQFTGREFKDFCTSLSIDYIMTSVYHPRSNGQVERFMDTDERSIQKFLVVYRIMPNPNTDSGLSPAKLIFARKIWSVFDRLLPSPMKKVVKGNFVTKFYKPGDCFLLKL